MLGCIRGTHGLVSTEAWCAVDPPRPVRHVKRVVLVENEQKTTEGESLVV